MKANIPSKFTLGGCEYKVELIPNSALLKHVGLINMPAGTVSITTYFDGVQCTSDYMESSFYHELVHGILDTMGKKELSADEELVEGFANLLHQYIKTKK